MLANEITKFPFNAAEACLLLLGGLMLTVVVIRIPIIAQLPAGTVRGKLLARGAFYDVGGFRRR